MKKEQKLFSIGEIARLIGVTRRIILNYEDRGLIRPDVKDSATGNRYYTIDTFTQIRTIRTFQDLGLSLDEIRAYFDDTCEIQPLIQRLEKLRDELQLNIERLYERARSTAEQVREIQLAPQCVYRRVHRCTSVAEKTVLLREAALEAMRAHGTDVTRRMYFIEHPLRDPDEISFCVAIPPDSEGEFVDHLHAMRALCITHHGAYEELPAVGARLTAYAQEHALRTRGFLRHTYLEGPPQHKNPENFITQVILPLAETDE